MVDPTGPLPLPVLPEFVVYADHADPARFYAAPRSPRLALDDTGRPQIGLLLYGHKQGAQRQLKGGQCTLTTELTLRENERAAIAHALVGRPAQVLGCGPQEAPPPEILSFTWLDGTVEVQLAEGVIATGKPSLAGTNQCALMASLSSTQAEALQEAWEDGLPKAWLRYTMRVPAAHSATTSGQASDERTTTAPGRASRAGASWSARVTATETVPHELVFEGPLRLTPDQRRGGIQVINL